jgi:hypothetical protein
VGSGAIDAATIGVAICTHALDRVPLSLIVDDSAPLVNANYFWLRDRVAHTGRHQRWEDVPVVIPEAFTREWAQWCAATGVRGKYTVLPCPAALGRIDRGLPLFGRAQLDHWLAMCREVIAPSFDITPELLTHSWIVDVRTLQPLPGRGWEQYEWRAFDEAEAPLITDYIALACDILASVGLPPQGVTSPGGFGGKVLPRYARIAGEAVRRVTGNPLPYVFQRVTEDGSVETPVWHADRQAGTAVGEVIACAGDHTGSWTGYGEADADRYITADLLGGRLPEVIAAGDPCVLVSHWQGFYGLHDGDRRGFRTLQTVVERLRAVDPHGERTRWRTPSEITGYACMRALATLAVRPRDAGHGSPAEAPAAARTTVEIELDLPARVPELTLRVHTPTPVRAVSADGAPLTGVDRRRDFRSGTFLRGDRQTLVAYDPRERGSRLRLTLG